MFLGKTPRCYNRNKPKARTSSPMPYLRICPKPPPEQGKSCLGCQVLLPLLHLLILHLKFPGDSCQAICVYWSLFLLLPNSPVHFEALIVHHVHLLLCSSIMWGIFYLDLHQRRKYPHIILFHPCHSPETKHLHLKDRSKAEVISDVCVPLG